MTHHSGDLSLTWQGFFLLYLMIVEQSKQKSKPESETGRSMYGCPVDKDELGRSTWNLLHTMAARYPNRPSDVQKNQVKQFFGILSQTYPCKPCADDLTEE